VAIDIGKLHGPSEIEKKVAGGKNDGLRLVEPMPREAYASERIVEKDLFYFSIIPIAERSGTKFTYHFDSFQIVFDGVL